MNRFTNLSFITASVLALCACSSAQEQLGLTKQVPDEFKVVKRAPLELPPEYTLRPPQPGAARPQEISPDEEARQSVFGGTKSSKQRAPTDTEEALLLQAGAQNIEPNIRQRVDQESAELSSNNQPVIDKILRIGSDAAPPSSVVDASKEAERLKNNKSEGKPVTEGETPSFEN